MTTTESNKLIAEFMQFEHNGDTLLNYVNGNPNLDIEPLEYHTSWDWLMPVVNECMQRGDNTNEWDALFDALSTCNRTNVYLGVVEFINQQNK